METKTMNESIKISAPKQKVWEVLMNEKFLKQWYTAFGENMKAETDWKEGSRAIFTDASNSGLIGRIIRNNQEQLLEIEYEGEMRNGKEDYESESANAVKGGKEIYQLTEHANATMLNISCDVSAEYCDMMSGMWKNALDKIKQLAEHN